MTTMSLAFEAKLAQPHDRAIETVTAALKSEGFGVLTRIAAHTTFTLGQIKGSLDRDLVALRESAHDHEQRIRRLEQLPRMAAVRTGEAAARTVAHE